MSKNTINNTLFSGTEQVNVASAAPLAVRMRPRTLAEFAGQSHFIGPDTLLTRMLEADNLTSLIFYGPAGIGKTSLAMIIASHTKAQFHYISAPAATVKDIRGIIEVAKDRLSANRQRTVLFIDEIHRFSRSQQDVLLKDVESGVLILIGATTENPFFSVNSPLISRSTIFHFEPLSEDDILKVLNSALSDNERGFGKLAIDVEPAALKFLAVYSDGDARRALTALEVGVLSQAARARDKKIKFDIDVAKESVQRKAIEYDGTGDTHYDLASALQKSMRGSDPDATVYWLGRMIAGGEDLRFIARRIAVCAAEDVGNADPMATVLAAAAIQICELVGLPEAQLHLAQAAIYIACAPKSNASAVAIWDAVKDVKTQKTVAVPKHLRDGHYKGAKNLGHGIDYKYPHSFEDGFVVQEYLPADAQKHYYKPKNAGHEKNIKQYLQKLETLIQNSKMGNNSSEKRQV
ncbi:MAG: replication-associated recombination protein A [Planctomycetes bacterium]|nr:replication-associated recombination protein A [Planctomycetota bacterium]